MEHTIRTKRLDLRLGTLKHLQADLKGAEELGMALGDVLVPENWPPEYYDADAINYTIDQLKKGAGEDGFSLYYFILRPEEEWDAPVVIGVGGFKGAPVDGRVEVGYGILSQFFRKGFATEAVAGFLRFAFAGDDVNEVIAETYPHMEASIGVMLKNGFEFVGEGSEPGVVRYSLPRSRYVSVNARV